jgi:hypothetical protein
MWPLQAELNAGVDLKRVVRLPMGDDMDEWLAMHSQLQRLLISMLIIRFSCFSSYS